MRLRNEFQILHDSLYKSYICRIERKVKYDSKEFWKYIDLKRSTKGIPSSMFLKDKLSNNTQDICDLFADYFEKVYKRYAPDDVDNYSSSSTAMVVDRIDQPLLSEEQIITAIHKLNNGCGHDGIPSSILQQCANAISKP